ncbi:MAG: hypothetical protein NHG36_19505, partial [Chromatiaceae bacterium]|nr:hypothetical protein [Candidatus Thioaporhodococcus sediminis]
MNSTECVRFRHRGMTDFGHLPHPLNAARSAMIEVAADLGLIAAHANAATSLPANSMPCSISTPQPRTRPQPL